MFTMFITVASEEGNKTSSEEHNHQHTMTSFGSSQLAIPVHQPAVMLEPFLSSLLSPAVSQSRAGS